MIITGAIKTIDLPEDVGLTTAKELVRLLEKYLAVELPVSQITNVTVSSIEPDVSAGRDTIWFRLDNAGNFIGIYVFIQGSWLQLFPTPRQLFRMTDSRNIPAGYAIATHTNSGVTEAKFNAYVTAQWVRDAGDTYWEIFDVVYVGL